MVWLMFDHDVIDDAPAPRLTARLAEFMRDGFGLVEQCVPLPVCRRKLHWKVRLMLNSRVFPSVYNLGELGLNSAERTTNGVVDP